MDSPKPPSKEHYLNARRSFAIFEPSLPRHGRHAELHGSLRDEFENERCPYNARQRSDQGTSESERRKAQDYNSQTQDNDADIKRAKAVLKTLYREKRNLNVERQNHRRIDQNINSGNGSSAGKELYAARRRITGIQSRVTEIDRNNRDLFAR